MSPRTLWVLLPYSRPEYNRSSAVVFRFATISTRHIDRRCPQARCTSRTTTNTRETSPVGTLQRSCSPRRWSTCRSSLCQNSRCSLFRCSCRNAQGQDTGAMTGRALTLEDLSALHWALLNSRLRSAGIAPLAPYALQGFAEAQCLERELQKHALSQR
jgi:hypothetical protein